MKVTRRGLHLLARGSSQHKRGEDGQGVFGVSRPALDGGPHGQAEHRHGLGQREGLVVLLWVPAQQTWTKAAIMETRFHQELNHLQFGGPQMEGVAPQSSLRQTASSATFSCTKVVGLKLHFHIVAGTL